ncbi:hypothetical protein TYRP_023192, partial [Tyrophagus putrescentiae]
GPEEVHQERRRECIDDADEKTKILRTVRDEESHLGFFKSAEVIRERFFWSHWKQQLKQHIRQCDSCQMRKNDDEPFREEMMRKWLEASALPDTLSRHDHAGAIGAARPPALQSKPTSGADLARLRMLRAAGISGIGLLG